MSLLNYLYKDILQYVFNFYIYHFVDVHILEKFINGFKFDLKPFIEINIYIEFIFIIYSYIFKLFSTLVFLFLFVNIYVKFIKSTLLKSSFDIGSVLFNKDIALFFTK